jgi:hypothetical protein
VIGKITLSVVMSYAISVFVSLLHFPLMHYTILFLTHIYSHTLDHVEPGPKVQAEQVQVENLTNLVWIKVSSGVFNHALYLLF